MIKKIVKSIIIFIGILFIILILLIVIPSIANSPVFVYRTIVHGESDVADYEIFPERVIRKSGQPYSYARRLDQALPELPVAYKSKGQDKTLPLASFIKKTDTTSFIIVKNDAVVFEQYANGYAGNSVNTSFSMAKSVVSLLIGKAVEDGFIQSETQSIADYITEFKGGGLERITIRDLLLMRSDIVYDEDGILWFGDDTKTYYMPDLRKLALAHTAQTTQYGGRFHYNNYHPLLLGIILERSTGTPVATYLEQTIWQKLGAEYDASWSLDSEKTAFEKMESGINFKSIDFIKIGSMLIHDGYWNDRQVVNRNWLQKSVLSSFPINPDDYIDSHLKNRNIGYQYMWYAMPGYIGGTDYFAWGKYGQFLYISPANNVVILRTGITGGGVDNWPEVLNTIASGLNHK